MGIPATVSPDSTILGVINSQSSRLPKTLEQHLRIAYHSYSICQALGNNIATTSGLFPGQLSMMRVFDATLYNLESSLASDLSSCVEMAFLRAKLQLYSFAFAEVFTKTDRNSPENEASIYLVKIQLNAIKLIEIASQSALKDPWPAIVRASVVYAAHVLLKLYDFPGHQNNYQARNALHQAWILLNARSELQHDSWSRACEIIAYLSRTDGEERNLSAMLVKSRMSANIVIESVWRARSRFSEDIRSAKPSDYTAAAAAKELFQYGLDFLVGDDLFGETFPDSFTSCIGEVNQRA